VLRNSARRRNSGLGYRFDNTFRRVDMALTTSKSDRLKHQRLAIRGDYFRHTHSYRRTLQNTPQILTPIFLYFTYLTWRFTTAANLPMIPL